MFYILDFDVPKILSFIFCPSGVAANPPSPVSLRAEGIVLPMRYIAPITSSHGIRLVTPASAKSADRIARVDLPAFLFTQDKTTSPATGSQTTRSILSKVRANASAD